MKGHIKMKHIINPYSVKENNKSHPAFMEIEFDNGRLSISGVIHPYHNGDAWGGCGQIIMDFKEYDSRGYLTLNEIIPSAEWDLTMIKQFLDYWDKWHLNDMKAACEHQRELGWDKEPIDPTKPLEAYGKFYKGQSHDSWNMKGWVYPPHGYLTASCPVCGYKYGTAWLKEEVPTEVINWLFALPATKVQPAWV